MEQLLEDGVLDTANRATVEGFLDEAARRSDRIAVVDAGGTADQVHAEIRRVVLAVMGR